MVALIQPKTGIGLFLALALVFSTVQVLDGAAIGKAKRSEPKEAASALVAARMTRSKLSPSRAARLQVLKEMQKRDAYAKLVTYRPEDILAGWYLAREETEYPFAYSSSSYESWPETTRYSWPETTTGGWWPEATQDSWPGTTTGGWWPEVTQDSWPGTTTGGWWPEATQDSWPGTTTGGWWPEVTQDSWPETTRWPRVTQYSLPETTPGGWWPEETKQETTQGGWWPETTPETMQDSYENSDYASGYGVSSGYGSDGSGTDYSSGFGSGFDSGYGSDGSVTGYSGFDDGSGSGFDDGSGYNYESDKRDSADEGFFNKISNFFKRFIA